MKLKIATSTETEIEIPVPCFSKCNTDWYALLSDNVAINLYVTKDYAMVVNSSLETVIERAAKSWLNNERITEEDFFKKYNEVIKSLSLEPTIHYAESTETENGQEDEDRSAVWADQQAEQQNYNHEQNF